jgi:DNA-binding transcriptional LysR family regulator
LQKKWVYAAPSYLDFLGNPTSLDGLNEAEFIGFDRNDYLIAALNEAGLKLTHENFPVITENHLVQWQLVKQGVGIGIMPVEVGDAESSVQRALPGLEPLIGEIWLVAHRELKTSRRVRMVFDFLASELSGLLRPK